MARWTVVPSPELAAAARLLQFFQSFSSLDSIIADMASRNWQLAPEAFAQKVPACPPVTIWLQRGVNVQLTWCPLAQQVRMSDGTALSPEDASIPGPLAAGLADARPDITFSYCSGEHQDEYAQWLCNGQHCR